MALNDNSAEGRARMGAALRAIRESKGLSCEEVGQMVGVSRQTISKIELGKWSAGADHLSAIADALGYEWVLKEKMKNYCFYYKGEEENPYEPGTDINRWWWHESVYFREGLPKEHKHWEESALNELHSIPAIEPIMCDYDVPIETKGFLCYTVASTMGHAPMEDFWYLADYGRGFLPERIWDGSHEDVPMTEEELHKLCRYYKGGDQNPFEMDNPRYTFWEIEKTWAKLVANDPHRSSKYLVPFLLAFDGGLPGFPVDETIKATMYEHFIRFGGSKDAFCQYLTNYVNLAL